MKKQTITKKDILRRLKKDNLTVCITWLVIGGIFAFGGFATENGILLILGFLCITMSAVFCISSLKKHREFHLILNPVNHISLGDNLADSSSPTEVYFNYHNTYGRYRYTFYTYKKGDGMQEARAGKLFYLVFTPKAKRLLTEIDLVFPADTTMLDSELAQKLQQDAPLTGCVLSKEEGILKPGF